MNALHKALDEMKYRIPMQVLHEAFKPERQNWRDPSFNLDAEMLNQVIKPRVMIDANLVAGEAANIFLTGIQPDFRDEYVIIYQIPDRLTHNREIMSVLSIAYMPYSNNAGSYGLGPTSIGPMFSQDTTTTFQQMAESYSSVPHIGSASCDLIGYNKVRITDPTRSVSGYILRVYLTNEQFLNNINPRSYPDFCSLCEHAIKAHIYRKMIIKIDQAFLQGGQELGAFKNIVDGYADSEVNYQTFLRETWAAVAHMNNSLMHERFMKAQIPIGL